MDYTAMGRAALTGWQAKVGRRVAEPISERTKLTPEQVEAILGGILLVISVLQFVRYIRKILRAGRQAVQAA